MVNGALLPTETTALPHGNMIPVGGCDYWDVGTSVGASRAVLSGQLSMGAADLPSGMGSYCGSFPVGAGKVTTRRLCLIFT